MTIGPLPPHPGLVRVLTGGPLNVPALAPGDDAFGDALRSAGSDRRIGGTLLRETVERFNEHGFFADGGTLAAPGQAIVAPPPIAVGAITPPPIDTPGSAANLAGNADPSMGTEAAGSPPIAGCPATAAADSAPLTMPGADPLFDVARAGTDMTAKLPPATVSAAIIAPQPVAAVARPAVAGAPGVTPANEPRPPQNQAARSPIIVTIDTGEAAAAVTVGAHGLTRGEAEALRIDIAALLRRHGLALDDVRINGRPMGHGQDKSGG